MLEVHARDQYLGPGPNQAHAVATRVTMGGAVTHSHSPAVQQHI